MTITRTPTADALGERIPAYSDSAVAEPPLGEPQAPRLMTASKMCGNKVLNRQNETLGQIDEIVVDVPRGRIAYAAMASGNCTADELQEFVLQYGTVAGWPKASLIQGIVWDMAKKIEAGLPWNG